jgi:hypothetical protein
MRYALSLFLNNMLVDAQNCDYQDFERLFLVCPICRQSVFLVGEKEISPHQRKIKDRIIQVKGSRTEKHFAHHKSFDASACELRVSKLSAAKIAQIQAETKKQYVKILHNKFWLIIQEFSFWRNVEFRISFMKDKINNLYHQKELEALLELTYQFFLNYFKKQNVTEYFSKIILSFDQKVKDLNTIPLLDLKFKQDVLKQHQKTQKELNYYIAEQAFRYLLIPRQQMIVKNLFLDFLFDKFYIYKVKRDLNISELYDVFFEKKVPSFFSDNYLKELLDMILNDLNHFNGILLDFFDYLPGMFLAIDWCSAVYEVQKKKKV